MNFKYKKKLQRLKRVVKDLLFENAALCDHVAQIQESILCVKEERRFFFRKLLEVDTTLISELNETPNGTEPVPKRAKRKKVTDGTSTKSQKLKSSASGNQPEQIVQTIAVDASGRPLYPIQIGNLSIFNLGEIEPERRWYHTAATVYPIGFMSTRIYGHWQDPERKSVYICKILDGGERPRFEIILNSDDQATFLGQTPDECHAALLQAINQNDIRKIVDVCPGMGDWFFGIIHPAVMTLLQPTTGGCLGFRGFKFNQFLDLDNDPAIGYEALQRFLSITAYHTVPEIKEEPPDELLES